MVICTIALMKDMNLLLLELLSDMPQRLIEKGVEE